MVLRGYVRLVDLVQGLFEIVSILGDDFDILASGLQSKSNHNYK